MCIRDRLTAGKHMIRLENLAQQSHEMFIAKLDSGKTKEDFCLLYTSDAADERSSVDLGGRRIIKKKKKVQNRRQVTN